MNMSFGTMESYFQLAITFFSLTLTKLVDFHFDHKSLSAFADRDQ